MVTSISVIFWWVEAEEVNEATKIVEAAEVIEVTKVPNAKEIIQYVKCMLFFYFLRPKRLLRSLRPMMLSCLLRSLRPLKFSEPLRFLKSIIYWLESPYFDVLKENNFSEILPSLRTEAVEDRDVTFNQIKGSYIKFPLFRIPEPPSN